MRRYYIKSLFHGWGEVTEERYEYWCKVIREGAVALTVEQREERIKERSRIEEL